MRGPNFVADGAHFTVSRNGRPVAVLQAQKRRYLVQQSPMTEAGILASHGEIGELYTKSPTLMNGYWNAPEATAEVLEADAPPLGPCLRRAEHQGEQQPHGGESSGYHLTPPPTQAPPGVADHSSQARRSLGPPL